MIVVDASIAAKWYLHEAGSEDAAALPTSADVLVAPALIRIEVTEAMLRRHREGKLSRELTDEACDLRDADLRAGTIQLIPDETLVGPARVIALHIRLPIQDCLYLAAAESNAARFVTADPTFHVRAVGAFPPVILHAVPPGVAR